MPRFALAALLSLLALAGPAAAHKLNVFARVEGRSIEGKAYYRGGGPAEGAAIAAYGPSGEELGRTTADAEGRFSLPAAVRCDHRLVADAGGGHAGEFQLSASELPADLPPANLPAATAPAPPAEVPNAGPADATAELAALRAQVVALREQLEGYEAQVRFRDVLGGIGFLLGAMGLAIYVGSRRRGGACGKEAGR